MKIIIVGGGQVGSYLASLLVANGHKVHIIEQSETVYNKFIKEISTADITLGNASDPIILKKAGIATADVVAAVTGADEVNLVVSTLAKMEFGIPRVVARVNNPKNAWLYNPSMGVDVYVNQSEIMAQLVVEEMNFKNMFTLLKLSRGDYSIIQMKTEDSSKAVNQYIKDLSIPKKAVLISITRDESVIIPRGDTRILAGDDILALTDEESCKYLKELF